MRHSSSVVPPSPSSKSSDSAVGRKRMNSISAMAGTKIGVSMALFDDNFLTVLRNGMIEQAKGMDGVELQVEDAQNDVAKQLDQIKNFAASGVAAIIVNPVDTSATQAMTDAAKAAKVRNLKILTRAPAKK